ncbi:plastid delta12-fatty acid acetylenase [Tanacetum coccineum]|uniref:Plastid delta12-fatty acid acetylenase n=1 Tax=Tanacetum coccineum TaxID=301880 RepID=A0ABQ5AP65_9ASTR
MTCLIIYVDDMIITGNDESEIKKLKEGLCVEFKMKDLGNLRNLVTWKSKKQKVISLSSVEAEFRGIAKGLAEALWIRKLVSEIGFPPKESIRIMSDNKAAIQISKNPVQHDITKHVEVDRHFIKEKLETEIIKLPFVKYEDQLADILTKAVGMVILYKCLNKLNFGDPTIQLEGEYGILKRVPIDPPFSLSDLKKANPAHCFVRSVIRSSYYVVHDLIVMYVFYFLANNYIPLLPTPLACLAWPFYWFCQASILTGLWVIGHECGHHAFSEYQLVDDIVGFVLHSALFTPYFSWKYSHRSHHANTNSLDNDEVYIPKHKSKVMTYSKILNNPPGRVFTLVFRLTLRFPLYLLTNVSGKKYERFANHFDPLSPIFTERERIQVVLSDIGIIGVVYALKLLVAAKGFTWVMCMYGIPVIGVHAFFVLITYLHHTHLSFPHYDSTEWKWIKGALSTIDQDFGLLNREARDAIKPVLGDYYKIDRTHIFKAMWRKAKECIYIEPDQDSEHKGVYWYYKL